MKTKKPGQKTQRVDLIETRSDGTMQLFELRRNPKPKADQWPDVVEWLPLAENSSTFIRIVHHMRDDS